MTADRDALLDLLGAVERVDRHSPNARYSATQIPAALWRARRHLDRQRADARAEPSRTTREYALDLVAVIGVHEQSTGFELVLSALAAAEERGRETALRPFEELYAGGPDTVGRTTWRENPSSPECSAASIECVEVPVDDLRDAFEAAGGDLS